MRIVSILLILNICSIWAFTAPSQEPPANIPVNKSPMFISIGFDDNGYSDAMTWLQEYLVDKKNPTGNGNPKTFDGQPARVTFYCSAKYGDTEYNPNAANVIQSWKALYDDGHEIGNHSYTHGYLAGMDSAQQSTEISTCSDFLVDNVGIPRDKITGFRAPYLNYNDVTISNMAQVGLTYDCSIEHSLEGTGTSFYWPYQLDEGSASPIVSVNVGSFPGTWEVPMNEVIIPEEHTNGQWHGLTGLDYNMWVSRKMTKEAFLATLKYTLDQRLAGNRAPFTFGAHSDYYSVDKVWDNWASPNASLMEMREAFEEFIDYALSKPDVRIVPVQSIIDWMENPVALDADVSLSQNQPKINKSYSVQISSNKVSLILPQTGAYTVSIHTISGRKIYATNGIADNSPIVLPQELFTTGDKLLLISMEQNGWKQVERIVLP